MPIHAEVLQAAVRLCRERGTWTFSPAEIVRALPHLNPRSGRTHVVSRCCINAPKHHPHKWGYFRRVGRGRYEVVPAYRDSKEFRRPPSTRVAETSTRYASRPEPAPGQAVHAVLHRDEGTYVAECLEVAVVTEGRTLDELLVNLREAVALHLEGEDPALTGLVPNPRLILTYETPLTMDASGS